MSSIVDVSQAVADRIRPALLDWQVFWFKPMPIPVPSICVCPDPMRHADYQVSLSSLTNWFLRIEFHATAKDRDAAYRTVGTLTDPSGMLIRTLLDEDIVDDLSRLCGMNISITDGKGWKMRGGRSPYLTADIGLVCGAN